MALANESIARTVPDLTTLFYVLRPLGNRSTYNDLPSLVSSTHLTLATLPLARRALVGISTYRFTGIDMAVYCLVAHRNF